MKFNCQNIWQSHDSMMYWSGLASGCELMQPTTAPGRPKKLRWFCNVLLLLLFFSGFWYELSGWACSLHAACWLNRSSLLVLILEQQNSTNQKKTGQNGERIVRTFHVNIFSHLFRPKLLWKTNLKRIKSYRIYISSNSRPEQVTEVIFIKYLWEENSLFLYKLVNFFKTLRRNFTGDFLDGPVLLWLEKYDHLWLEKLICNLRIFICKKAQYESIFPF